MNKVTFWLIVAIMCIADSQMARADSDTERKMLSQIEMLADQLQQVQDQLRQVQTEQSLQRSENQELRSQLLAVQSHDYQQSGHIEIDEVTLDSEPVSPDSNTNTDFVDLAAEEFSSIEHGTDHVLSNPWYKNIDITGFGAIGYYDTGSGGSRENGSFEVKESSLFIEGSVWENVSYFLEFQINRLGVDPNNTMTTGEVYVNVRNISLGDEMLFGVKMGRIDLPFGEEYLWQDAIDNPLITNSAMYPYGWDEGILVYSRWGGVNWIAAVTDGSNQRSRDSNSEKAINVKLYGNPSDSLYLSASYMHSGDSPEIALQFGGAHPMPVGTDLGSRDNFTSLLGDSSSEEISMDMMELDARYEFSVADREAYVALTLGRAELDDADSIFDRDFTWFSIEPYLQISPKWYTLVRYSEIGTYDSDQGYLFGGKIFAKGLTSGGYDTKRLRRLGLGLGWMPNPRVRAKLELGKDWLELIDGSPLPLDDNRNFFGLEVAVGF